MNSLSQEKQITSSPVTSVDNQRLEIINNVPNSDSHVNAQQSNFEEPKDCDMKLLIDQKEISHDEFFQSDKSPSNFPEQVFSHKTTGWSRLRSVPQRKSNNKSFEADRREEEGNNSLGLFRGSSESYFYPNLDLQTSIEKDGNEAETPTTMDYKNNPITTGNVTLVNYSSNNENDENSVATSSVIDAEVGSVAGPSGIPIESERNVRCSDDVWEIDVCQNNDLHVHSKTHAENKSLQCHICNKRFAQKKYLKRHILTHRKEKPFTCHICRRSFTLKHHLKDHLRIHTGEKPYTCQICNKRFTQLSTRIKHIRTHTGERPFTCHICKRGFSQSSHLKTHMLTHSRKTICPQNKS